MHQRYIYVIFSATPYKIGRFIRSVTGADYNHVSVALSPDLQQMYGFSRRYYKTPFYGGFVCESPSRYCPNGTPSQIQVCRLPITDDQFQNIHQYISGLLAQRDRYLYNHLSALTTPFHLRVPVKDAYLCVEFCAEILNRAGMPVNPKKYYSTKSLGELLREYTIYEGPMEPGDVFDEAFFQDRPLPHPIRSSLRSIAALLPRVGKR